MADDEERYSLSGSLEEGEVAEPADADPNREPEPEADEEEDGAEAIVPKIAGIEPLRATYKKMFAIAVQHEAWLAKAKNQRTPSAVSHRKALRDVLQYLKHFGEKHELNREECVKKRSRGIPRPARVPRAPCEVCEACAGPSVSVPVIVDAPCPIADVLSTVPKGPVPPAKRARTTKKV